MSQIRIFSVIFTIILIFSGQVDAQIPTQIPITLPVNGDYIFGADSKLVLVDTYTGQVQVVEELENARPVRSPNFDFQGQHVVYLDPLNVRGAEVSSFTSQVLLLYDSGIGVFSPQDWDSDIASILGIVSAGELGGYELQILNTGTSLRETVLRYEIDSQFNGDPNLLFNRIGQARWNPTHSEWIALQIIVFPASSEPGSTDVQSINLGIVFNQVTGEELLVNDVVNDDFLSFAWSPDGEYLIATSLEHINIIELRNTNNLWSLVHVANVDQSRGVVIDWLGINDLFLYSESNQNDMETVLSIGQIINNNLFRTELFRIPRASFSVSPLTGVTSGSWHLSATQEERYQLSCLFDQALSARIGVGDRARVNFTDGTPLRLRTEPDFDAAEVTQMAEGTEFDVIGGSACVNASDYYRFWQLQLDDGTRGWAAEANTTDYFIEPIH